MNSTRQQNALFWCAVLAALMLSGTGAVSAAIWIVDGGDAGRASVRMVGGVF